MTKRLISAVAAVTLLWLAGCAASMEEANRGAHQTGQTVGGVVRLPNSVAEGAAAGIAGEGQPNPYRR